MDNVPVFFPTEKVSWPIDTLSSTIFLSFDNRYPPALVAKRAFVCLLSLYVDASYELTIGISGDEEGEVVLREMILQKDGYVREVTRTGRYLGRGISTVAVMFHRNEASVYLDGFSVLHHTFDYRRFSRIYFGSCEASILGDVFLEMADGPVSDGRVHKVLALPRVMTYAEIIRKTRDFAAGAALRALDAIEPFIARELELSQIQELVRTLNKLDTFSAFILTLPWALDRVVKDFVPGSKFVEATIRDKVYDLCLNPLSDHNREEYETKKLTDLAMKFRRTENGQGQIIDTYRVEFKMWGASGYKGLPAQPLKYMGHREIVGATVLIDRRKTSAIGQFIGLVKAQIEYPCLEVSVAPHFDTGIPYFISLHRDVKFNNPRLIVNFYLHIPK